SRLRDDHEALRLVGGVIDAPRLVERDDLVAPAMHDEEWHRDLADALDGAVLIDHDEAEGKALPHELANVDRRGERRLEHERLHFAMKRKPRRDRRPERLAVGHDIARGHALAAQAVISADGVRGVARLARAPFRAAVAAVVQHEHAVARGSDGPDLPGAVGDIAAIAGE